MTTVFVTHDQEEALEIADRVVVMSTGRIEQIGTSREVYDHPATPFVIEFLGDVNRLAAGSPGGRQGEATYIRPHDIGIARRPTTNGAPELEGIVKALVVRGGMARVELERVDNGEHVEAQISRARLDELNLRENERVFIELLKPQNLPADCSI